MTDKYLPSTSTYTAPAVGSIMLEPEKWAAEFHKLAVDYAGEPEQVYFMNASRRFTALAKALKIDENKEKPDGFVTLGDID